MLSLLITEATEMKMEKLSSSQEYDINKQGDEIFSCLKKLQAFKCKELLAVS